MLLRLCEPQQTIDGITVNDAYLCPEPDANNVADLNNIKIVSRNHTEVPNYQTQLKLHNP